MDTKEINRGDSEYGPGFAEAVDAALSRYKKRFVEYVAERMALAGDPRFVWSDEVLDFVLRDGESFKVRGVDGTVVLKDGS
jgi:hypothetical protein